jgi:hypothetical protein
MVKYAVTRPYSRFLHSDQMVQDSSVRKGKMFCLYGLGICSLRGREARLRETKLILEKFGK